MAVKKINCGPSRCLFLQGIHRGYGFGIPCVSPAAAKRTTVEKYLVAQQVSWFRVAPLSSNKHNCRIKHISTLCNSHISIREGGFFMRMINGVLLVSVLVASGFGAPPQHVKGAQPFPSMLLSQNAKGTTHVQSLRKGLAKRSALIWEQIASTYYVNDATSGDPVDWAYSSRDTTVYDANGHETVSKASLASTGWTIDSLISLDSSVYAGGNLAESIYESFSRTFDTVHVDGTRNTYTYPDGGKSFVNIYYNWSDSKKTWVPNDKDSMAYSAPIGSSYAPYYYTGLIGNYLWVYDTTGSSWAAMQGFARVDAECNATTLTLGGQKLVALNKLADAKEILTFKSSDWTHENLIQDEIQVKDSSTGTYYDYSKTTYTVNADGSETDQYFYWNATSKSLVCLSKDSTAYDAKGLETSYIIWSAAANGSLAVSTKYLYFHDAHDYDTLDIDCDFDSYTQTWDTTMSRYARTYDGNGNNSVTIISDYGPVYDADYNIVGMGWTTDRKTVNTFAQFASAVLRSAQPVSKQAISIAATKARVTITTPNITGLTLYNAAGRMVASVKQQAAESISLEFSGSSVPISSGIYVAKLTCGAGQSSFRLPIQR
jgi:hypothetical protein